MVKGSSKRVVVVDSPDKRFFEQAIFIVRNAGRGVTSRERLEEARRVAKGYTGTVKHKKGRSLGPLLWTALGGILTGAAWAVTTVLI